MLLRYLVIDGRSMMLHLIQVAMMVELQFSLVLGRSYLPSQLHEMRLTISVLHITLLAQHSQTKLTCALEVSSLCWSIYCLLLC